MEHKSCPLHRPGWGMWTAQEVPSQGRPSEQPLQRERPQACGGWALGRALLISLIEGVPPAGGDSMSPCESGVRTGGEVLPVVNGALEQINLYT